MAKITITVIALVALQALTGSALPRSVVPPSGSNNNVGCWPGYICFYSNWNRVVDRVCGSDAGDRCVPQDEAPELHLSSPPMYSAPLAERHNLTRPSGTCQVRLDFLNFQLAQPDAETPGDCGTDTFKITGAENLQGFVTCGDATGQHLILQYGVCDTILVNVLLGQIGSSYDILVTYLPCNNDAKVAEPQPTTAPPDTTTYSPFRFDDSAVDRQEASANEKAEGDGHGFHSLLKTESLQNHGSNDQRLELAPDGCAQYFTQPFGTVTSFNYQSSDGHSQYQLNNQRYCSCVKNLPGSSKITWRPCSNSSFSISRGGHEGSLTGNDCSTDYIDIPGSPAGRYCGSNFPSAETSIHRPYMMCVNFDDSEFPGANLPFDPSTGCQIGFECIDPAAIPPLQPPGTFCDASMGMHCVPGPLLASQLDTANTGFCLEYQVT